MKKDIDSLIPSAYQVLKKVGIANEYNVIIKTYRGQISSFGSAVKNGSLLSAIAFFSIQGNSATERQKLMEAIWKLLNENQLIGNGIRNPENNRTKNMEAGSNNYIKELFEYVCLNKDDKRLKENIINCAIALKLAMNIYDLENDINAAMSNDSREVNNL